jgi:hypothetical protein
MATIKDILQTEYEMENKVKKTTDKSTWKKFELAVAKDFKTHRTPLSGMVKTITNSDTLHKEIYVECKYRAEDYNFWDEFMELRKSSNRIVAWKVEYKGEMIFLLYYSDFFDLMAARRKKLNIYDSKGKYRSVLTLFRQTEERAEIEEKTPVIALKRKNCRGYLIGTHPEYFEKLREVINR